jgi:hypothetical protein
METTKWTLCLSAILLLCLAWPAAALADPPFPNEPGEEFLVGESYDTVIGLLFRDYSLRGNGHVDYRTARHILGISYDDPASGEPDVALYPLFYWYDANQDGQWDMWVDRDEKGHLTDAVRYDWKQGEELLTSAKTW